MTYKSYAAREIKKVKDKLGSQLTDMAGDIVKQAQENANQTAPSHPQVQTGTLRRSILMDVDKDKLEAKVGIMKGKGEGDKALEYAEELELGSVSHPPYPYLFPAAEMITKKAKDYFR